MKSIWSTVAVFMAVSAAGAQRPIPRVRLETARSAIARLIAASGAEVAVAWRPVDAGPTDPDQSLLINSTVRFHAASTMKVPVMIELFREADAGLLKLDDRVILTNRFHSIVDGTPYELSPADDSDDGLYKQLGQQITLRSLCEAMITRSSNLAANVLIERLGAKNIQATTNALGASGMQVLRGVEDQKAFDAGLNNTTDAVSLLTLLWKLGRGEAATADASREMIAILKGQTINDGIPAGLPAGTVVAHKTGTITNIHHDAGIVYGPRPYVIVVLVRGIPDEKLSASLIAQIAGAAHQITN